MNARQDILGALRRNGFAWPLPPLRAASPSPATDLTARFEQRAAEAGAEVYAVDPAALPAAIVRAVSAAGARTVILWDDPALAPVRDALRAAGIRILSSEQHTKESLAAAEVGITTADYGVVESGTLVLAGGPGRPRAVSLLPRLHLAVLPVEHICADLFELMTRMRDLPSSVTFITGPSRSADIELTPVRGAHGPVAVTIFLLAST